MEGNKYDLDAEADTGTDWPLSAYARAVCTERQTTSHQPLVQEKTCFRNRAFPQMRAVRAAWLPLTPPPPPGCSHTFSYFFRCK